jgi:flagellar biosynthesis protein FlhB
MRYLLRMTSLNTSAQPRDVDMAFWLWVASLLVSLIGQLFGVSATVDGLQDSMQERSTQPLSPDALASMAHIFFIVIIVVTVLFIALLVFFGVKMRAGRNWARITITVLTALEALSLVNTLMTTGGLEMIASIVSVLLAVAAVVLMFRPDAKAYFAPKSPVPGL